MEQNNVRTYILYAIGEIALVMIGILLALQVNNWNEQRKDSELEMRYLIQIYEDLKQDSINIARSLEFSNSQVEGKNELIKFLDGTTSKTDSLGTKFRRQWAVSYSFNPVSRTFDEMTSTGTLDVLREQEIKQSLLRLQDAYAQFNAETLYSFNLLQRNSLALFYQIIPDLYTLTDDKVEEVLKNFQVENSIRGNSVLTINAGWKRLKEENGRALKIIRKYVPVEVSR